MKLSQIIPVWKPKKPKKVKLPDAWFFGVGIISSPSYDGEAGAEGGMSESIDDWEAEEEPKPKRTIKVQPRDGHSWQGWEKQSWMLDDAFGKSEWETSSIPVVGTTHAISVILKDGAKINYGAMKTWGFKIVFLEGEELGVLPPKTVKEGRDNFGFRPEYRQFWFEIADEKLFFRQQHEHELINNGTRTMYPDASFIERVINKHIMKPKPNVDKEFLATIVRVGALKGNNPITAPMVFMYNPSHATPNIKVMKEYGLKPRFLEIDNAR